MLIAEIHGKRFPEAENQEDWLTSAVFGHLRHVLDGKFWRDLFSRAFSTGEHHTSLYQHLSAAGVRLEDYAELRVEFWHCFEGYGEPDVILLFSGGSQLPLTVVVEVKLNSGKSGTGDDDQLKRYLELIDNSAVFLPDLLMGASQRYLVYLTRNFAKIDIEESVELATREGQHDAAERLYGLQWQDVLECAEANGDAHYLLKEVADFLRRREFEAFRGFRSGMLASMPVSAGAFYGSRYFATNFSAFADREITGRFLCKRPLNPAS